MPEETLLERLKAAMGLEGRPITRLVILCDLDAVPEVFFVETMDTKNVQQAAEALAAFKESIKPEKVNDVAVDQGGNVLVEVADGTPKNS